MPETRPQELAKQIDELHTISLSGTVADSKAAEAQTQAIYRIAEKEGILKLVRYSLWNLWAAK